MKTDTICRDVPCDQGVPERPRYYARQLITADDLTLEQDYFRNKLRMHNRLVHGWGVVCGALVCLVPKANSKNGNGSGSSKNGGATGTDKFEPWKVMVKPGYILGPYGDDINIDCSRTIDLRTSGVSGVTGEPCVEASDPWCSEVFVSKDTDKLYIAVRYKEIATRPVRVQPIGCGCDDTQCEYSRYRDGYEIGVLDYCPGDDEEPPDIDTVIGGPDPECPPCPTEPWVGLAEVTLDPLGNITRIDNCSCRRLVASFGNFWWKCKEPAPAPAGQIEIDSLSTKDLAAGVANQPLTIEGKNLDLVEKITFGDDIGFNVVKTRSSALGGTVSVPANAAIGPRSMNVTAKDPNKSFTVENAIKIVTGNKPQPVSPPGPTPVTPRGVKTGRQPRKPQQ